MSYDMNTWAAVCLKAAGLRFVRSGAATWVTEELAQKAGMKVVEAADTSLVTARFAKERGIRARRSNKPSPAPLSTPHTKAEPTPTGRCGQVAHVAGIQADATELRAIQSSSTESNSDQPDAINELEITDAAAISPTLIDTDSAVFEVASSFPIMDLPPELRMHTLSFLAEGSYQPVFLGAIYGRRTGMMLPSIVKVCRLFRAEYLAVAIEQTTWAIHDFPGNLQFQRWLARTDLSAASSYKTGFDAIKSLAFP
ncbi:hypothetical protein LTR53_000942 [Teratosphaeriaceae sp. CCFEE 6253]|nr:hypothetical protein LTR53_000942 [Teratosphaeriaceae sp. CCFEE 6253]